MGQVIFQKARHSLGQAATTSSKDGVGDTPGAEYRMRPHESGAQYGLRMTTIDQIEQFKTHALWASVDKVIESFDGSTPRSTTDRQTIARVTTVMKYLREYKNIPAYLFPAARAQHADQLHAYVTQIDSQWQGWDETAAMTPPTESSLDTLCDQILNYLFAATWPPLQKESRARIYQLAADAYQSTSESSLSALQATIDALDTRASAIEAEIVALRANADATAAQAASTLELIEATRVSLAENAAEQLQAELKKAHDAATTQRSAHADELAAHMAQVTESSTETLTSLHADAVRGKELLQIVGDQSQAGGYLKFAQREKVGYRLWITVGVVSVILTLAYLAVEFRELATQTDPSLGVIILKSALSLTALAFSGFCFREAGKRQRQSLDARYRALDLLALRPFTYGMDDGEARLLRGMLGERLFKNPPEEPSKRSDEKVTTFRLDLADLKTAVDTAKTAKDLSGLH